MWKNNRLPLLIWLLLMWMTPRLQAQDTFNIKTLIDKILLENYALKISRNEERIAAGNNTLGRAGFLPQLNLEAGQSMSLFDTRQELFTGTVREGSASRNTSLNALVHMNWTLFDGFRMFAQRDKLGYLEELGVLETRYLVEQTLGDVVLAYYQLVREQALFASLEENLMTSRFRFRLEQKRVELGSGNALQLNQAQVDYYTDSAAWLEQRSLIRSMEIQLGTFIHRDPSLPFVISDTPVIHNPLPSREEAIKQAQSANVNLRVSQLEELISHANTHIQCAALLPSMDLFGRYAYTYQTSEIGFAESSRSLGPQFGISIRMNLFNGGINRQDLRSERLRQESALLRKDNTAYMILATLEDLYGRYAAYEQQLRLAEESLQAAGRSLAIARLQWEQGSISGYDLRLTQLGLFNTRNQVIRLAYTLKTLETEIDRITGGLAQKHL